MMRGRLTRRRRLMTCCRSMAFSRLAVHAFEDCQLRRGLRRHGLDLLGLAEGADERQPTPAVVTEPQPERLGDPTPRPGQHLEDQGLLGREHVVGGVSTCFSSSAVQSGSRSRPSPGPASSPLGGEGRPSGQHRSTAARRRT